MLSTSLKGEFRNLLISEIEWVLFYRPFPSRLLQEFCLGLGLYLVLTLSVISQRLSL